MAEVNPNLVVEADVPDDDSAYGDETASYTTSLATNIRAHMYENGRRYHSYNEGQYILPNDEAENDRLDMHNHLANLLIGGKLHTAPIGDNPQRILDIGCGTGIWSIDIADKYPSAEVKGVDLSPTQPTMIPPNLSFEIDNVEQDWTFSKKFDYIHCRFMACSILDWPKLVRQCYENTAPGGYTEFKDWDLRLHWSGGEPVEEKDSQYVKYHNLGENAMEAMGVSIYPGPSLKKWAEEAGFVNVTEKVMPAPLGVWPKDKKLKEIGAWNYLCLIEGLEGIAMRMLTKVHNLTPEEVNLLCAHVRKELKTTKIKAQYTYYVVVAQKPEEPKHETGEEAAA